MVDWSKAPEGATHWGHCEGNPYFWKIDGISIGYWKHNGDYYRFMYSDDLKKTEQFIATLTPRPAVDWSKAPDGAEYYGLSKSPVPKNAFFKFIGTELHWFHDGGWKRYNSETYFTQSQELIATLTPRPAPEWPSDNRIDVIGQNGPSGEHYTPPVNKYDRVIHGKYGGGAVTVDVYRVLNAFGPLSPEIDHAVKKLLAPGNRGHKDEKQDLLEAIQSIEARLKYLEDSNVN